MKMLSAGRVSLLGVVLVSVGVSDAVRETLTVSEGGVDFTVVNFSDDRNRPHRLRFRQDGILSQYTFNRREEVTTVRVGAERYTVSPYEYRISLHIITRGRGREHTGNVCLVVSSM